ncbi:MAG: YfhO family protein [Paramuribaculum sp.]|nr:YfhO family protein [Paramuribaculum sp.]
MSVISDYLHRKSVWGVIGSVAVIAIIAIAFFYPDNFEGNVLRQHDMVQGMANGHEVELYREATGVQSRWTNSLFSGMPTFQIAPSYESNSLFSWIDTVMGLGLPQPSNLLFMMMAGFFILLLVMRMRWYIALIGAVAYGFSSYFIIIIGAGHIWKFVTLAYIPPTIAGLVLCYRGRYLAGGALAALFTMMQIASNHVQMTYYFLLVMVAMSVAYLVIAVREKSLRRWLIATAVLVVAGAAGALANLPSLYNTYEYSKQTMRGGHSELNRGNDANATADGLDRDYITQYSYGRSETFTLLIPNVKGGATSRPEKGANRALTLAELPQAQQMYRDGTISADTMRDLSAVYQYFGEPEGTSGPVYVGALIFALFLLGCVVVKGPVKWALLVMTILSILLALGRNCMWLTDFMLDVMPMYNKFRTPESILVIAEFTMPLLAMLGLQKLFAAPVGQVWNEYRRPVLVSFGITLVLCLAGIVLPSVYGAPLSDPEIQAGYAGSAAYPAIEALRHAMVADDAMRSFLITAAGFGVLLLYFRNKMSMAVAVACIGVVVAGDLYMVGKRYVDHESFTAALPSNPQGILPEQADVDILSVDEEFRLADGNTNYRVLDLSRFTDPRPSYFHKMIGGYHAAKLTRYQDMIDYYLLSERNPENMINMLNAQFIIQNPKQAPIYNDAAMGNAWLVDKIIYTDTPDKEIAAIEDLNLGSEAVADESFRSILGDSAPKTYGDTIYAVSYAPDKLGYNVRTAAGGVAVLSEIYFPWGWKATIDGKPVEIGRVNYLLRALKVPAGEHDIELTFDPESLHVTTSVAYMAIIVIYLAIACALAVWVRSLMRGSAEPVKDDAE